MRQYQPGDEIAPGYVLSYEVVTVREQYAVWSGTDPNGVEILFTILNPPMGPLVERFLTLWEGLHHPNLVKVHASWFRDDEAAFATRAGSRYLADRLQQLQSAGTPGVPLEELLDYMEGLAAGLDSLAAIHADPELDAALCGHEVNPATLALEDGIVRLADLHRRVFRLVGIETDRVAETSPVSAVALAYYWLRTGVGPTPESVQYPDLAFLPSAEQPIVARALSTNPEERYLTVGGMVAQLRREASSATISVTCTYCGQQLVARAIYAGMEVRCPTCRNMNTLPSTRVLNTPPAASSSQQAPLPPFRHFSEPVAQHNDPGAAPQARLPQILKCPFCHFENDPGTLFCEQCRSDLSDVAPQDVTPPGFPPAPRRTTFAPSPPPPPPPTLPPRSSPPESGPGEVCPSCQLLNVGGVLFCVRCRAEFPEFNDTAIGVQIEALTRHLLRADGTVGWERASLLQRQLRDLEAVRRLNAELRSWQRLRDDTGPTRTQNEAHRIAMEFQAANVPPCPRQRWVLCPFCSYAAEEGVLFCEGCYSDVSDVAPTEVDWAKFAERLITAGAIRANSGLEMQLQIWITSLRREVEAVSSDAKSSEEVALLNAQIQRLDHLHRLVREIVAEDEMRRKPAEEIVPTVEQRRDLLRTIRSRTTDLQRLAPEIPAVALSMDTALLPHVITLGLCHVHAKDRPLTEAARWLRGAAAAGRPLPLGLARDLGLLLTCPADRLTLAVPDHLPKDTDTSSYLALLRRVAAAPLVRELPHWVPPLGDKALAVVLAKLVAGLRLPDTYRLPTGPTGTVTMNRLEHTLAQVNPAALWHQTALAARPDWNALLPPNALAQIEANLRTLDREEVRFLARYGPGLTGSPDPRDLLDLLSLTGLPPAARLALSQCLRLLPRLSGPRASGGIQIYPEGGYEGLARRGSLDSLLPTELAYPRDLMLHRVLNGDALYYGRERPRERRRELAYVIVQLGLGLGGDGQVLARALVLALGQAMQHRGYDVQYSFAGTDLSDPRPLDRPGEIDRVLYHQESTAARPVQILQGALRHLKPWRDVYRTRQVLWVLSEHFDADDHAENEGLYRALEREAGNQAWFIRVGPPSQDGPPVAQYFAAWQVVETSLMWHKATHEQRRYP